MLLLNVVGSLCHLKNTGWLLVSHHEALGSKGTLGTP